jgi:hypothetical protein
VPLWFIIFFLTDGAPSTARRNSGVSSLITNGGKTATDCDVIFHYVMHLGNLYAESLKMTNVVPVVSKLFDFLRPKE